MLLRSLGVGFERLRRDFRDLSSRRIRPGELVSMSHIEQLNRVSIENVMALPSEQIRSRLQSLVLTIGEAHTQWSDASNVLREEGIFIVPHFVDAAVARKLAEAASNVIAERLAFLTKDSYEDDEVLVQRGASVLGSYRELANYQKPVIQVRLGQDEGMIDLFNADHLLRSEASNLVRERLSDPRLLSLLEDYQGVKMCPRNMNIYLNKGVCQTRGFHVDSYERQLKAFIYLTDVETLDHGPYVYVKGSHKNESYQKINRYLSSHLKSKTEAPVVNSCAVTPILAPAGTLIVSDQGGIHRGFPQIASSSRIAAVMNYKSA